MKRLRMLAAQALGLQRELSSAGGRKDAARDRTFGLQGSGTDFFRSLGRVLSHGGGPATRRAFEEVDKAVDIAGKMERGESDEAFKDMLEWAKDHANDMENHVSSPAAPRPPRPTAPGRPSTGTKPFNPKQFAKDIVEFKRATEKVAGDAVDFGLNANELKRFKAMLERIDRDIEKVSDELHEVRVKCVPCLEGSEDPVGNV